MPKLHRLGAALTALAVALSGTLFINLRPSAAQPDGSDIVINEVYARGGSANQPYREKFIELFNPTSADLDLSGISLGYSAATNPNVTPGCALQGVIKAGGYFLVSAPGNGEVGAALPNADQQCKLNMSGTKGSVTLLRGVAQLDLVGYGESVRFEGMPAGYVGDNKSPGSIQRKQPGVDTDNNAADFEFTAAPSPQGSDVATPTTPEQPTDPDPTPDPQPTDPVPQPTDPDPTTDPKPADPEPTPVATPTTDPTRNPGPDPQPAGVTPIADIQGSGEATPIAGQVVTTWGVVTAVYPTGGFNGFYLQTPGTGKVIPATSHGIFVYGTTNVDAGKCYRVTGTAAEYNGLTQLSRPTEIVEQATGCQVAIPVELGALPSDAEKEQLEGMLVLPQGEFTITNNYQLNTYGQLGLAIGSEPLYVATEKVQPGQAAQDYEAANLQKYITLDDGSSWNYMSNKTAQQSPLPYLSQATPVRTGSKVNFTKPVIMDYRFQWNFQPTGHVIGAESSFNPISSTNDRPASAPNVGGDIQIASFNVLNYFTDLGKDEPGCQFYADRNGTPVGSNRCKVRGAYSEQAFLDQQAKIVSAINGLDAQIVALMEMETSSQFGHGRDQSLGKLVDALNASSADKWAFVPSPLVVPDSEDVIRLAYIYKPSAVTPVDASQILVDSAFANARQPLAQRWAANKNPDAQFVTIANHFKSKGSGEDDGTGQGLSNPSRIAQARALTSWADQVFAGDPIFLMGDFNAYSQEDPVKVIEGAGYANVEHTFAPDSATYQFSGRLGSLDHIFANSAAMQMISGAGIWNINGDESVAMQYSRRNYNVVDFYQAGPFASSDHDPALVGLNIPAAKPSPSPTPTATPSSGPTATATVTQQVPGPTATATVTQQVPGPTVTATATTTVPGPTATATVTAQVPGSTVTATQTTTVPGPTTTVTLPAATTTATVTATQQVPGPTSTVTATQQVPGPTATVTATQQVPGPTSTVTVTATQNVPGLVTTVTAAAPTKTVTATKTATSISTVTIPAPNPPQPSGPCGDQVQGAICQAWLGFGAEQGRFGRPTSNEISLGGDRVVQHFQGGDAYWAPGAPAWFVHSGNRTEWERLGGINGPLGAPTGNEISLGGDVVVQTFERGRIYWSPKYGARAVHGGILTMFLTAGGHEVLGVPMTGEYRAGGRSVRQDFTKAVIQWA